MVAAAVRLYPVQPLPREAATVSAGEFCGPQEMDARSASQAVSFFGAPAPTHQILNSPPGHNAIPGRDPISFNCTSEIHYLGTTRGIQIVHNPEQG